MRGSVASLSCESPSREVLRRASRLVSSGGILLYPSDTVYGLLCDATAPDSVRRLAALKGYSGIRPFIVLVSGLDQALRMARFSKAALLLAERFWPGPLTLVAPAASQIPSHLRNELEEIALRSPADPISQGILELAARPLVSTSANLAGGAHAHSVCDVPASVRAHCGLVLDGGEIPAERLPSTVARAGPEGLEILREGALPSTDLKGRAPDQARS